MVQYIKDQLIRAKVYLTLTATRNNAHFIRELRQRIKELQKAFSDATTDSELPGSAKEKMKAMDLTLEKGKQLQDDCIAMAKKLRAILHTTEEQLRVHRKQTTFLSQLTAKTLPKVFTAFPCAFQLNTTCRITQGSWMILSFIIMQYFSRTFWQQLWL